MNKTTQDGNDNVKSFGLTHLQLRCIDQRGKNILEFDRKTLPPFKQITHKSLTKTPLK